MKSNDHNICLLHKAREEFACVNSICRDQQNKLSCYKCLEAQHINQHNQQEDFKSIYTLIEHINQEKEERLIILENAKQWSLNQKKENRQALEKLQMFSQQYIKEMSSKIDEQYDECCHKINYIQICLEETNPITPYCLQSLINFYKQNTKEFSEQIETIKFQCLGNILIQQKQSDQTLIESLKKMQDQIQLLENKVNQLSTQRPTQKGRNHFYPAIIISLITIVIIQSFYFPHSNFETKIEQKIKETFSDYQDIQNEKINYTTNQLIDQINLQIQELSKEIIKYKNTLIQQEINYNDLGDKFNNIQLFFKEHNHDCISSEELLIQLTQTKQEINEYLQKIKDNNDSKFETNLKKSELFIQISSNLESKIQNVNKKLIELESKTENIIKFIQEDLEKRKNHHKGPGYKNFADIFKKFFH